MASTKKRKHVTLTLSEKCKILDDIETGKSVRQVADIFKVSKSTVFDIKMNKMKIRKFVSNTFQGSGKLTKGLKFKV